MKLQALLKTYRYISSASEVTTLWCYTNLFIIIIIPPEHELASHECTSDYHLELNTGAIQMLLLILSPLLTARRGLLLPMFCGLCVSVGRCPGRELC